MLLLACNCYGQWAYGLLGKVAVSGSTIKTRNLTIDHTKCGTATSSNWFTLYKFTDATLKSVANGGHVQSASGYDIQFFSDAGCTVKLAWSPPIYDPVAGSVLVYVGQFNISSSADVTIYMQYGDVTITTFQGATAGNPFNTGFMAVYPLDEASSPYHDITANTNNSASGTYPSSTTGQIYKGQNFVRASNNVIVVPNSTSLNSATSSINFNAWVKPTTTSGGLYQTMLSKRGNTNVTQFEFGFDNSSSNFYFWATGSYTASSVNAGIGTWHNINISANGSGASFSLDAATAVTTSIPLGTVNSNDLNIGAAQAGSSAQNLNSAMEFLTLSNFQWTTSNITTTYNMTNNNSTFITTGAEH